MDFLVAVLSTIIRILGFMGMFRKSGIRRGWAWVPIVRNIKLAQCADDEDSGSVWGISYFLLESSAISFLVLEALGRTETVAFLMVGLLTMIFAVINFVYSFRIYSSLCQVYGRKKRWILLWMVAEPLAALIWGFFKKFQPSYVVRQKATEVNGTDAEYLEQGLTVNITKRTARKGLFSKKTMLRDVHFNIHPGKMVLLLGGSGAGKTTLINAVTGYEPADASILLNGKDVYREFRKVIYDIGVVPQQELIRNTDTVYRTLLDSAALRMPSTASGEDQKKRVNEVMEIFGLMPIKNALISKQSGGQKKRISIATEYISNPSLFILDEPDSGLDGILARELMQKLHDISREGKIVMVVTHTPDRVIDLFDEVIVLAKDEDRTGRLVFKGPVAEAKEFFDADSMEQIVRTINRPEEGGLGRTDELLKKFIEMREGAVSHA